MNSFKKPKTTHLCKTCKKYCQECFDRDTEVFECDYYKKRKK